MSSSFCVSHCLGLACCGCFSFRLEGGLLCKGLLALNHSHVVVSLQPLLVMHARTCLLHQLLAVLFVALASFTTVRLNLS